jgi:hypothetical protein
LFLLVFFACEDFTAEDARALEPCFVADGFFFEAVGLRAVATFFAVRFLSFGSCLK